MKEPLPVEVRDAGNYLEVTLLIPWETLAKNEWDKVLNPHAEDEKRLRKGIKRTQEMRVIRMYEKLRSISRTAKACNMTYYDTRCIIDAEISRRRREHRAAMMQSAQELARHGASRQEIATILGKSAETIRRWLKVHHAPIRARGTSLKSS